ncbi:LysM peptidoglycan-binding domain-containing protein [Actinoplanes sp. URMC 104]|uniref:LysM peptidoglycan-binding domain-containing protein n=1 Tax=Actinoplanes sp. URMC 104 TaxID=3423409 RepID=UPI003F1BD9BA
MSTTLIETVLWPAMHALEPPSKLGGTLTNKPGYHASRDMHRKAGRTNDYSMRLQLDLVGGPSDTSSAIDWTFPDAQRGDYRTINKYSARLLAAGRSKDPRAYGMREFFGNADGDREVEGWDFYRDTTSSSDTSHLWHIHISVHRCYVNNPRAIDGIISILKGEPLATWQKRWGLPVTGGGGPVIAPKPGDTYTVRSGDTLSKIAARYKTTVATLKKVNGLPSDLIRVGQVLKLVAAAPAAPKPPAWPNGANDYYRPRANAPYYALVGKWQARMKQLGWPIDADGYLGPKSGAIVKQFQKQVGLRVDGMLNKATFDAAWTSPKAAHHG